MLIVVTLGVITGFAPLVELGIVANGFIMFYLFQYGVSIVENWEAVGLPVPSGLKKFLDKRKKELDEREYDK